MLRLGVWLILFVIVMDLLFIRNSRRRCLRSRLRRRVRLVRLLLCLRLWLVLVMRIWLRIRR